MPDVPWLNGRLSLPNTKDFLSVERARVFPKIELSRHRLWESWADERAAGSDFPTCIKRFFVVINCNCMARRIRDPNLLQPNFGLRYIILYIACA